MRRRTFLTTLGTIGLAGCGKLQSGPATETETDSQWPSNTTESSPENTDREWNGGHRDATMNGGKLVLENVTVEMVGANVAQQVGVTTSETDQQNSENIPESKFEWYGASENAFIWFVYVNFMSSDDGEQEIPDPDLWRAQPILEDGHTPAKSFTSSFDPDPTYYRLPGTQMREYTQPAYTNPDAESELRVMVFEVESDAIELLYGNPPQVTWMYEVE